MQIHLLLTPDLIKTKPESSKLIHDFGMLSVVFEDPHMVKKGIHCIVEDTKENIINWLKPFDYFIKGSGMPQLEQFEITHINLNKI